MVAADTPHEAFQRGKNTECYVHALLENQKKHGANQQAGLDDIAENLNESTITSGGANLDEDTKVEHKGCHEEQGQEKKSIRHVPGESQDAGLWNNTSQKKPQAHEMEHGETNSRLLTKKQLSDMAWGVRELSKRLGSIKLKLKVKTVFLLTKAHDEALIGNTREVAKWLLSPDRQVKYNVWIEEKLRDNKKFNSKGLLEELDKEYAGEEQETKLEKRLRYWNNEMCRTRPHTFDFIVTLGGDGTVLYASWLFQRIVPPVLSFALGSLGFLTKFDYEDFADALTRSFRDGVTISLRLRFEGTVMRSQKKKKRLTNGEQTESEAEDDDEGPPRDLVEELVGEEKEDEHTHKPDGTYEILNDIVVDRGPNPSK